MKLRLFLLLVGSVVLTACGGGSGGDSNNGTVDTKQYWTMQSDSSTLNFVTTKAVNNAEIQTFTGLSGAIDGTGNARVLIDTASVSTNIEIRDTRMTNLLFESSLFPMASFSTNLDANILANLAVGDLVETVIDGQLSMHGVSMALKVNVAVSKLSDSAINVRSVNPVIINASDLELSAGLEILRQLASLDSVNTAVPVSFSIMFTRSDNDTQNIAKLDKTPLKPELLSVTFDKSNGMLSFNWSDNSDNETGFIIKAKDASGNFVSLGSVAANTTRFMISNTNFTADTEFKIIAVNTTQSSDSSNLIKVPDLDGASGIGNENLDGATLYNDAKLGCASCHGVDGKGGIYPVPVDQITDLTLLAKVIADTMPQSSPRACGIGCATAIANYINDTFINGSGPAACNEEVPAVRKLRLLTRYEYRNTIRDLVGVDNVSTSGFPVENVIKGFDNNASVALVTSSHMDAYLNAAEKIAEQAITQNKRQLYTCDAINNTQSCASEFINDFGLKAFRRPLSQEEQNRYSALFRTQNANFDNAVQATVTAMLISPNFLYRSELGEELPNGYYQLSNFEVASSLSYTLWGTMPDQALLTAANAGQLSQPAQIATQATRLLDDPRSRSHIGNFARQWLGAGPNQVGDKDTSIYPLFTPQVRSAMDTEISEFVNNVIFDSTGNFEELFTADFVMANATLAQYYGVQGATGNQFSKLPAGVSNRGGVLALGAVLAGYGHSNESAPVPRGLFVRDRLLCQELPLPSADLDTTPPGLDPTLTTRERFKVHSASAECQNCHQFIDGVGFGFENFDGAGGLRTSENGKPIDISGVVIGLEGLNIQTSLNYNGVGELRSLLSGSNSAKACMATQYYRFTHGQAESSKDQCAMNSLMTVFQESNNNMKELLVGITKLKTFTLRRSAQ